MNIKEILERVFGNHPPLMATEITPASPWTIQPTAMAAKAMELRMMEAMQANKRARDLMPLCCDWKPDATPACAVVEIKYDGIHTGYFSPRSRYTPVPVHTPFTREGAPLNAASHLLDDLAAVDAALGGDHVLFGEYINFNGFEAALADQKRGRGDGTIVLFDAVPLRVWEGRDCGASQLERTALLQEAVASLGTRKVTVSRASVFEGGNSAGIEAAAAGIWELGYEGLVVKDADAFFGRGRSGHFQRIKRKLTADLTILATQVVNGRLVSITLDLPSGRPLKVPVGFSEAMRRAPDRFQPGMVAEITHLGETRNGSYRSASFKRLRADKGGK